MTLPKILLILAAASLTTACATGTPRIPDVSIKAQPVQENLLAKCPEELPPLQRPTMDALIENHAETASVYHDCKKRHNLLVDQIRVREQ